MLTKPKIKIVDCVELRESLDFLYQHISHAQVAKWAMQLANHVLALINARAQTFFEVEQAFGIQKLCENGPCGMFELRQAAFKIHQAAKMQKSITTKTALRAVGQAVSATHMKEHAMVASDYAQKLVFLLFAGDMQELQKERLWQIESLKKFV